MRTETAGAAAPRDAASVLVVRDGAQGPEVYLTRRNSARGYLAGFTVFPGGVVEPGDHAPGIFGEEEARLLPQRLAEEGTPAGLCAAVFAAAVRETYEEAGLLFARCLAPGREPPGPEHPARVALRRQQTDLAGMFRELGLTGTAGALVPWSRWITPRGNPKRYDTRFFLAALPPGRTLTPDGEEMEDGGFLRPETALTEQAAGRLRMLPPTVCLLTQIAGAASVDDLFARAGARRVRPVEPQPFLREGAAGVLLPADPEYRSEGAAPEEKPGAPTRLVFEDGRWNVECHGPRRAGTPKRR